MSDDREIVLCVLDVSLIRAKLTRQLERLSLFNCIGEFDIENERDTPTLNGLL